MPDPTNPQDLNRFRYVRNNPLKYTDPSGHACVEGTSYCVNSATGQTSGNLSGWTGIGDAAPLSQSQYCNRYPWACGDEGHDTPADVISTILPMPVHTSASMGTMPHSFTPAGSFLNASMNPLNSSSAECGLIDCVLSAVSILTSGIITAVPQLPQVVGIAFAVDLVVTGVAILRTEEDYAQGEISQERRWILNGTGFVGVLPVPYVGLGLSVINGMATFSGYPP